MLELDHVFCFVTDPDQAARRLEDDGWVLDAAQAHPGQGTRNRRVGWGEQYFELLWLADATEAAANALRLDRRAEWTSTGASPFGLAFRGQIEPARGEEYSLYDALGPRIWVHSDNEEFPERPLVFVLEADEEGMDRRRRRARTLMAVKHRRPGELCEIRIRGPSAPSLPPFVGPPIVYVRGPHQLELVVVDEGSARPISDGLLVRS